MPATIRKEIAINAPIACVWHFVATADGLSQWWQTEIVLEAREGGRCETHTLDRGTTHVCRGVVTTYDPPRQLTLTFHHDGDDHWPEVSTISITLAEVGDQTRVTVVHRAIGAMAPPVPETAVPPDHETETPRPPLIVNQSAPLGDTGAPVVSQALPVTGADSVLGALHGLSGERRQWTQRLTRLQALARARKEAMNG